MEGFAQRGIVSRFLGAPIAEEYGGSPADEISLCIIAEEMARAAACLVYAHTPTVNFCAKGIQDFGSDEQKREYLPRVAAGELRFLRCQDDGTYVHPPTPRCPKWRR